MCNRDRSGKSSMTYVVLVFFFEIKRTIARNKKINSYLFASSFIILDFLDFFAGVSS